MIMRAIRSARSDYPVPVYGTSEYGPSRRVLPSFIERTPYGSYETTPYNKLFEERIVFIGSPIDDATANDIVTQLLHLEASEPDRAISLYINSPGGSLTAMAAIYDTMLYIRPSIHTYCLGQAISSAALLLSAGRPGRRAAVPNARIALAQPIFEVVHGQISDLTIQATEVSRLRQLYEGALARAADKPEDQVHRDIERELILTAEQAREYGLLDTVLTPRKGDPRGAR